MVYIAFNKPFQVLSQFKELDDKVTLKEFISHPAKPKAVGRLDFDSEGLLLLSDDDVFSRELTSPKSHVEKEYFVQVEGCPKKEDVAKLTRGFATLTETYAPCNAGMIEEPGWLWERTPPIRYRKNIPTAWIKIILQEGKNRQVRKMTAYIGYPALRLIRVRIGNLSLGHLKPGESKLIEKKDIWQKHI